MGLSDVIEVAFGLVMILLCAIVYFLPSIVSGRRKHHNDKAVIAVNLLLGWTIIGWIIAMVWACTSQAEPRIDQVEPDRSSQLERLARLKHSGDITQEEFDQEKRRIMST